MRRYVIHPHMTPKRLAYLRAVEVDAPYEPRHGVVANHCLTLDWVESVVRMPDGRVIAYDDMPRGEGRWDGVKWLGQRLTDKGREMLRRASA